MIKSTVSNEKTTEGNAYPRLVKGAHTGSIFLVTKPGKAVVVYGIAGPKTGSPEDDITEKEYLPFTGSVTLQNEG